MQSLSNSVVVSVVGPPPLVTHYKLTILGWARKTAFFLTLLLFYRAFPGIVTEFCYVLIFCTWFLNYSYIGVKFWAVSDSHLIFTKQYFKLLGSKKAVWLLKAEHSETHFWTFQTHIIFIPSVGLVCHHPWMMRRMPWRLGFCWSFFSPEISRFSPGSFGCKEIP